MSDDETCGRPALPTLERKGVDRGPVCLMHSRDPNKDGEQFDQEIRAILDGTSRYSRPKNLCDFCGFVFPAAKFAGVTFAHKTDFSRAWFIEKADFSGATFKETVSFYSVAFDKGADFQGATFSQAVLFARAQFGPRDTAPVATRTISSDPFYMFPCATFYDARFQKPAESYFFQVNNRRREGMRARFANCLEVDKLDFTDVHWFTRGHRIVLQDEIDVRHGYLRQPEIVAKAYMQLVSNFEKARSYGLAEDCFIGAMEMKRLDPRNHMLGPLGQWLSTTNLYRLLSNYGSSYGRALACLAGFLLLFALLFPLFGLEPTGDRAPTDRYRVGAAARDPTISWTLAFSRPRRAHKVWNTLGNGFWASVETATFQKNPTVKAADSRGQHLAILEDILTPGQLALFLLALRRRFRR